MTRRGITISLALALAGGVGLAAPLAAQGGSTTGCFQDCGQWYAVPYGGLL